MIRSCRRLAFASLWLVPSLSLGLGACSEHHRVGYPVGDAGSEAGANEAGESDLPPGCDDDMTATPDTLACTGLFENLSDKKLSRSVVEKAMSVDAP